MEFALQVIFLMVGAISTSVGFTNDPKIVWAIVVGIILLLIGVMWLIISTREEMKMEKEDLLDQ